MRNPFTKKPVVLTRAEEREQAKSSVSSLIAGANSIFNEALQMLSLAKESTEMEIELSQEEISRLEAEKLEEQRLVKRLNKKKEEIDKVFKNIKENFTVLDDDEEESVKPSEEG